MTTHDATSAASTPRAVIFAAVISSMTAAALGYDVGIMADAIEFITEGYSLNDLETQLVVGSLNFVAALGTLIAGYTSDLLGRKPTVYICGGLYIVGTALMAFAPLGYTGFLILLLGRIVTGLGVGVSFVVTPTYICEICPSEVRGMLTTCFDISINVGIVIGYLAGFIVNCFDGLGDGTKWRVMLGLGGCLPLIVLTSLSALPESPRWLVSRQRRTEATTALVRFLGDADLAAATMVDIDEAQRLEAGLEPLTWGEFFFPKERHIQHLVFLVLGLGFWQQATGSEAVLYYSGNFLEQAGMHSRTQKLLGYIGVGLCKLVPEAMVMLQVDKVGRRPLLVYSSLCVTLVILGLSVTFFFAPNASTVVVALLCLYMASFSMGMGPVTWLVASEVLPLRQRAKGMTLCCFVNRLTSGIVALTVLSTCDALGYGGFFLLYGCISGIGTLWFSLSTPETKGKSLEDITSDFRRRYPTERRSAIDEVYEVDSAHNPLASKDVEAVPDSQIGSINAVNADDEDIDLEGTDSVITGSKHALQYKPVPSDCNSVQ